MYRKVFISAIISFISVIPACRQAGVLYAQEYKVVRGIVDLHSNISDGLYPLEKIAELAKEKDITVLIFADSALRKWEYGLWPFRSLIKKTQEENSVLRLGIEKYLKRFAILKKEFPGLVIIPALEVNPFYYWEGNPLSKNFSLNDWYKQFLVIGLNEKDYKNLPIVGNHGFGYISLSRFNQYQGQQQIKPYQDLINYVNEKRGLVFWAHPDMESMQRYKGIEVYTPAHPEDLFLSHDYTGFGVTFTDRLKMIEVGDVWDNLLLEYLEGRRKKPVWVIGTLHYDGLSRKINEVETVFFVKDAKQEYVLDALREGKMYVRFNFRSPSIILREFNVENLNPDSIQITIKGTQVSSQGPIEVEIIRNGKVIKILNEERAEFTIVHTDKTTNQGKIYYRLKMKSPSGLILSNPLFIFEK